MDKIVIFEEKLFTYLLNLFSKNDRQETVIQNRNVNVEYFFFSTKLNAFVSPPSC